jgi:hypothetical protein
MSNPSIIDQILLRDRLIVLGCLVLTMALTTAYTVVGIGGGPGCA